MSQSKENTSAISKWLLSWQSTKAEHSEPIAGWAQLCALPHPTFSEKMTKRKLFLNLNGKYRNLNTMREFVYFHNPAMRTKCNMQTKPKKVTVEKYLLCLLKLYPAMISQPLQERQQIVQLSDRQGITLKLYNLLPHPKGQSDSDQMKQKLYSQTAGLLGDNLEDKKLWRQILTVLSLKQFAIYQSTFCLMSSSFMFEMFNRFATCEVVSVTRYTRGKRIQHSFLINVLLYFQL